MKYDAPSAGTFVTVLFVQFLVLSTGNFEGVDHIIAIQHAYPCFPVSACADGEIEVVPRFREKKP